MPYQKRGDVHFRFYYNRHIVPARKERVPGFHKVLRVAEDIRLFKKNLSLFKDWKIDTSDTIDKSLGNDFHDWNIKRIVTDTKDMNAVCQYIRDTFLKLMQIRVGAIAESN